MRARILFLFSLPLALAAAPAPLNPPTPLAPVRAGLTPAQQGMSQLAAERAQALGFPTVAAALYRELLAAPGADRADLSLALATALLDDGRPEEAQQALSGFIGVHGSAWHLRSGLAAAERRRHDLARVEVAAVKPAELTAADQPWYFFLQGMLAGAGNDLVAAGEFYQKAAAAAPTSLSRARFLLAFEQARLRLGQISAETAEKTRQNAQRFAGTATGFEFARAYAVMLDQLGRKNEAVEALRYDLLSVPALERARSDDFRLLLGMIAGAADGVGRNALFQLLSTGVDPDRRRVALQLLARSSPANPGRSQFRAELDRLIAASPPDPILEDLLLRRAGLALSDQDYAPAEDAAHALLEKFPGSALKPYALGILAGSAWEQRRYRTAADYARQTRDILPPGSPRARLGVVVAEAWFRAGDYPSAADAYAAVLRDPPPGVPPGDLMFQRVEAEIRAGEARLASGAGARDESLAQAQAALDALGAEPAFDIVNRWEAEWNLARALELNGKVGAAYARVNGLLGSAPKGAALPPALRARMAWLQARLSYDAHEPQRTLQLVEALAGSLAGLEPASLRTDIASTGELLKAEASFDLHQEAAARDILQKLRTDFPRSDAAVSSYFVEAEHYAQQDKVVEAQQLLTRLADNFPKSPYAPYALYQAAVLAERLGQDKDLREADRLIDRLITTYPDQDIVFDARLKQGDLLRKLNQFPQAQHAYESLINNYARNPDVVLAKLALAECHNAQSASDPSHEETARSLFEDLCARVDAPVDVRVEAGFNLGLIYQRRARLDQAGQIWWRDVVTAFLLEPRLAAQLEGKGRYWMARTLLELGSLLQQQGRLDQAGDAWRAILKFNLPGTALARSNLASLNPAPPKP